MTFFKDPAYSEFTEATEDSMRPAKSMAMLVCGSPLSAVAAHRQGLSGSTGNWLAGYPAF